MVGESTVRFSGPMGETCLLDLVWETLNKNDSRQARVPDHLYIYIDISACVPLKRERERERERERDPNKCFAIEELKRLCKQFRTPPLY